MMRTLALAGALVLAAGAGAHAQERVSIGTGGTGGVFYAIGAGMAEILSNNMEGATANAEVTGASIENIRRVSAGQMTIGFSSASTLYEGKNGEGAFDGEPQNVAAIAALYPAVLQVAATKDSGAASIADLADLDISVGPPGSNSSVLSERLLTAYDAFNMSNVSFLSYGEATQALKNGQLEGTMILAGTPAAAFIELFTTEDVVLLPVTEADVSGMLESYPFYALTEIAAGTYEGQDAPVQAIGDPAILFVAADADEALVHDITATLFDNLETLQGVHPAASAINIAGASKTPIALHAGAKRYFDAQ
ncbi:TAXI family TRAP transporter solute-binding subunit [Acuticoccus sp. MNP-M23]|uniref:TAXI family TRAP transporter solute-binding subunit n=1 Tax=Acuticoccus sp. MNP-M23 TaxID=3072793 RepID=UPI0028154E6D|nr:TAXI family TRAP transporter solute-binding subunit [Acuticoccus sp. MNP-M23]WMS44445.1 TAXI family TRAP transporter solute-binding subunit [Acuticoccus sp. MNP-M23]